MSVTTTRKPRMYGLFMKQGRRWIRLFSAMAFPIDAARRIWQSDLCYPMWRGVHVEKQLRPIK